MIDLLVNGEGGVGVEAARRVLEAGGSALDAVEAGIRIVEADPRVRSVGRGGGANLAGEVRCDAAIMDGATLGAGAVGSLGHHLHAISVARQVMARLPHVLLVGEGAERFAREIDAEIADLLTPEADAEYRRWVEVNVDPGAGEGWINGPLADLAWQSTHGLSSRGTTVFIARDREGHIAGGTSTSGWRCGYPGRIGDSPIVGAGLYADDRYGACGCTHTGEMTIRAGTARSVVLYMKAGASVTEACHEALRDLHDLRGGYLGPVVIHAVDRMGIPCVVTNRDVGESLRYWHWTEGAAAVTEGRAGVMDGITDQRPAWIRRTTSGPS